MTLDQRIQIWNVVGIWLAGIKTFLADLRSLYLARKGEAVKEQATGGILVVFAGYLSLAGEHLDFGIVNLGDRPVNIVSIGWPVSHRKNKRFYIQPFKGQYTQQYPKQHVHGEQTSFLVSFDASPNWLRDFASNFVQNITEANIKTLRALMHTSVGKAIEVVPEKNLIERLCSAKVG